MTDENQDSFNAYNKFLETGELDRFTKVFSRYDLFKAIIAMPGDIVECGVFKGHGLLFWARLLQIFNPMSDKKVVGFDTFEGVPETVKSEQDHQYSESFKDYADIPEIVIQQAKALGIDKRIEIVKGDALKTIPEYLQKNPGFRIALLHLDFDVYEPTKAALETFYDRVVPGGLVVLDEYAVPEWGESNAVDEFIKGKGVELKSIPWALSPTAYFKKPV